MDLDDLILRIHAAALHPEHWTDVLTQLSAFLDVSRSALLKLDRTGADEHRLIAFTGEHGQKAAKLYEEHYHQQDGWLKARMHLGPIGIVLDGLDYWPDHQMRQTEIFHDYLAPYGTPYVNALNILRTPTAVITGTFYHDRPERQGDFRLLDRLAPHLELAARTQDTLLKAQSYGNTFEDLVNTSKTAALIVDQNAICLFANMEAEGVLKRRDGLFLRNRTVSAFYSTEDAALKAAIGSIFARPRLASFPFRVVRLSRSSGRPLVAFVTRPHAALDGSRTKTAIVFVIDPDKAEEYRAEIFSLAFKFTEAEARLAKALMCGITLREYAEQREISYGTVRIQLRQLLDKTGAKRQGELVLLLSRIASPMRST